MPQLATLNILDRCALHDWGIVKQQFSAICHVRDGANSAVVAAAAAAAAAAA